jgi:hypothetical protein
MEQDNSREVAQRYRAHRPLPTAKENTHLLRVILCFGMWCIISEVWATVWYIPMNKMRISGYEIVVVALFSPVALGSTRVSEFLRRNSYLRSISAIGIPAV